MDPTSLALGLSLGAMNASSCGSSGPVDPWVLGVFLALAAILALVWLMLWSMRRW